MKHQVTLSHEFSLRACGFGHVAGLDEAGRGAWAGPVVAGAVILPLDRADLAQALAGVTDSKQLTPAVREALLPRILDVAVAVGTGYATHAEIDAHGIVAATRRAMQRAFAALALTPDALLTDFMRLPEIELPCVALVRGDQQSLSIAAASIVAKVTRDRIMRDLDARFPQYGFGAHKGYGTNRHRQALARYGPSEIHRMTFAPLRGMRARCSEVSGQ